MSQKPFVPSKNVTTWETITKRMDKFTPTIKIEDYLDIEARDTIDVKDYPSDGIDFVLPKAKREEFLGVLREAQTHSHKQAFEEGRWKGALHAAKGALRDLKSNVTGKADKDSWALGISYKETKGIGFREIWYLELTERQLRLKNAHPSRLGTPQLDPKFASLFDRPNSSLDVSALHWAIDDPDPKTGRSKCNVHIDQVGIDARLAETGPAITPDVAYHTLVELLFRTELKGLFPNSVLQAVDFIMPSSHENYALNFGVQVTPIKRDNFRLSIRGMCSVHNDGCEWSGTVNLQGTHSLWQSK